MSSSTISHDTTTSELITSNMNDTIATTAPSTSCTLPGLDASLLTITPTTSPRPVPAPNSPEFQSLSTCTDHMITATWTSTTGWSAPSLQPYGALTLMPTASVLHYATTCFEGLKFYRGHDRLLRLFRPAHNCARLLRSATRIALPSFDPAELQKLIVQLVAVDGPKWLPTTRPGTFLYLRPTIIATTAALGVQKPRDALLFVVACCMPSFDAPPSSPPAVTLPDPTSNGAHKPGLKLLASDPDAVRAWPGGCGNAKLGANYGPSLVAGAEARARGYHQVLWLLGPEGVVTEAGACNLFLVWRTKRGRVQLVTAPLDDGVVLEGVTRGSVLELARERLRGGSEGLEAVEVVERRFTMGEVVEAVREERVLEAFVVGTAVSCFLSLVIGLTGLSRMYGLCFSFRLPFCLVSLSSQVI